MNMSRRTPVSITTVWFHDDCECLNISNAVSASLAVDSDRKGGYINIPRSALKRIDTRRSGFDRAVTSNVSWSKPVNTSAVRSATLQSWSRWQLIRLPDWIYWRMITRGHHGIRFSNATEWNARIMRAAPRRRLPGWWQFMAKFVCLRRKQPRLGWVTNLFRAGKH